MSTTTKAIAVAWLTLLFATSVVLAQATSTERLRELRMKSRDGKLTAEEKTELKAAMKARGGGAAKPSTPPTPRTTDPAKPESPQSRDELRQKRVAEYAERQTFVFERSRQQQKVALAAAAKRQAHDGPARVFHVNNEAGNDMANGL